MSIPPKEYMQDAREIVDAFKLYQVQRGILDCKDAFPLPPPSSANYPYSAHRIAQQFACENVRRGNYKPIDLNYFSAKKVEKW